MHTYSAYSSYHRSLLIHCIYARSCETMSNNNRITNHAIVYSNRITSNIATKGYYTRKIVTLPNSGVTNFHLIHSCNFYLSKLSVVQTLFVELCKAYTYCSSTHLATNIEYRTSIYTFCKSLTLRYDICIGIAPIYAKNAPYFTEVTFPEQNSKFGIPNKNSKISNYFEL